MNGNKFYMDTDDTPVPYTMANPCKVKTGVDRYEWFWYTHQLNARVYRGPYKTEQEALHALLKYCAPSRWQRFKRFLRNLWNDTRGQSKRVY